MRVLPRHVGVLGTTGGGKSTTVSGLIHQFSKSDIFTVVIDTEGEYTEINQPTQDKSMQKLLQRIERQPEGLKELYVLHLVGRGTTAKPPTPIRTFSLDFSSLSPYASAEIMELSDAQSDRFFKAYDVCKLVLRDLEIFPKKGNKEDEEAILDLNEFDTGYPMLTLSYLIDIAGFILSSLSHDDFDPFNAEFKAAW